MLLKELFGSGCHSVMSNSLQTHGLEPTRFHCPRNFPGKNTGLGCHFLLQEIFPTQRLNLGLPHCRPCRQMLYHLSHPPGRSKELFRFSSVAQSCPTLCKPMNRSMPGLLIHHQLPESTQTHAHQGGDVIQPSYPLSSPSPPAPSPSQHQGLFQ